MKTLLRFEHITMKTLFCILILSSFSVVTAIPPIEQYVSLAAGTSGLGLGYSVFSGFLMGKSDATISYSNNSYPNEMQGLVNSDLMGLHLSIGLGAFVFPRPNVRALFGLKITEVLSYENYIYRLKTDFIDTTYSKNSGFFFNDEGFGPMAQVFWFEKSRPKISVEVGTLMIQTYSKTSYHGMAFCQVNIFVRKIGRISDPKESSLF